MILRLFKKHYPKIFLFLILAFAAFLRLYNISGYMTFLGDEGRDVLVVKHILEGKFTLLGPTASVGGFFLGPIYYYFMAPFLWLFHLNPVGPAVMVALFGTATVWLVYKIGSEFFDEKVGLIAALFYSISPLVISYSRSSWNPNLMPFFSVLTLYFAYKGFQKKRLLPFSLSGMSLGVALQLHYIATFLAIVLFTYMLFIALISQKGNYVNKAFQIGQKYLFVILGLIVGLSPFLAFEGRHGFPNTQSILKFIFHSEEVSGSGDFIGTLQDVFFRLFGRLVTFFPPPEQVSLKAHSEISIWFYLTLILAIVSIIVFLIQYVRSFREKKEIFLQYSMLFFWFFLGILIFGFYRKSIYDYYFEFMFPLPFLFTANFLVFLYKKNILLKVFSILAFIAITAVNINAAPFRYSPNHQLYQVEMISRSIFDKTSAKPFNFALITGGNSDHAYRYFFELWKNSPVVIQNTQIDPERKSVTDQLFVVCETLPCYPLGNSLWEIAGFGRAEIVDEWSVSVLKVYKLEPYKGK